MLRGGYGDWGPGKAVEEMGQPSSGRNPTDEVPTQEEITCRVPNLQVLEEPVGEGEHVGLASAPSNDEGERITIEDVTDEEGGHVEDMDIRTTVKTKTKKVGGGVVQGK